MSRTTAEIRFSVLHFLRLHRMLKEVSPKTKIYFPRGISLAHKSRTQYIHVAPTVDTGIYASGDQLGPIQTLGSVLADGEGAKSILLSIVVVDGANQKSAMDLFFFDTLPVLTSSDNAAIRIADSYMYNCLGVVSIAATDYATCDATAASAIATKSAINLVLQSNGTNTTCYVVAVSRGTPTYAATDLKFRYGILQD